MAVSYKVAKVGEGAGYWDPHKVWSPGPGGISIGEIERHNNAVDAAATAANAARAYQGEADSGAERMVGAAREGVGAILGQGAQINSDLALARKSAADMSGAITNVNEQAGLLNQQAGIINAQAGEVNAQAGVVGRTAEQVLAESEALKPYADQLNQYAGQLWNEGTSIFGQGSDIVGLGQDILDLDENAGGIIGQYVKSLKQFDPKRYVAQAAADVQGAFDNTKGQLSRELSRSGVNLSGGAALAQKRLLAQTYAATLAGAKTRAWQTGATEQLNANRAALSDAMALLKQGTDTQAQGAQVQQAGVSAQDAAAGVQANVVSGKAKAGDLQTQAGQLKTQAGQLQKSAADTMNDAGGLYAGAGELVAKQSAAYAATISANTGYMNALNGAYGNLTEAYKTYTDYMASQAGGFAEYATSKGGSLF